MQELCTRKLWSDNCELRLVVLLRIALLLHLQKLDPTCGGAVEGAVELPKVVDKIAVPKQ